MQRVKYAKDLKEEKLQKEKKVFTDGKNWKPSVT